MPHASARPVRFAAALALSICTLPAAQAADLIELTATEAAEQIRAGKITSVELTTALLAQIEKGAELKAFITVDREGALAAAAAADRMRSEGKSLGPLHGVPIVLKDNIHVAGLPNTAGTPALRNFVPRQNAPVAQALIDAGAIVLGKTNMHELAFGITNNNAAFGAALTPYDKASFPGGSSGGTGAAVGARMAPAGLGSDTGGSVRIPAALNGISGLRPTVGRYSGEGITPISHTRDTAGPMARSVADLVLLDQVMSGDRRPVPVPGPSAIRLGVGRTPYMDNAHPEVVRLMDQAIAALKAAGVQLVEVDIPPLTAANDKVGFPVALYEGNVDLAAYLQKYETGLTVKDVAAQIASPDVKFVFDTFILGDKAVPEAAYKEALQVHRPALQQLYNDVFTWFNIDALVFPTTKFPALKQDGAPEMTVNGNKVPVFFFFIANTDPGSNAAIPGLSLPLGLTGEGLPVGIALDGPAGSDRRLLGIGLALEKMLKPVPGPKM
jgi:Asp-tRNA(Asn)/Glu-tRNA(Gln) amidotransferase A subunit family amidase